MDDLQIVSDVDRARVLMEPVRRQILSLAREPISASQAGIRLKRPRQNINYHFKTLEQNRFLLPAGEFRRGNMMEQRYTATARRYLLLPSLLGELVEGLKDGSDRLSAAHLLGLSVEVQSQLSQVLEQAEESQKKVATLSFASDLRFQSAGQRERFTVALLEAIRKVVLDHSSPATGATGEPGPGRPFRLVLGCYPLLEEQAAPAPGPVPANSRRPS